MKREERGFMKHCPTCNFLLPDEAKFCASCGNEVPEQKPAPQEPPTPKTPAAPAYDPYEPSAFLKKTWRSGLVLAAIILFTVMLVIGILTAFTTMGSYEVIEEIVFGEIYLDSPEGFENVEIASAVMKITMAVTYVLTYIPWTIIVICLWCARSAAKTEYPYAMPTGALTVLRVLNIAAAVLLFIFAGIMLLFCGLFATLSFVGLEYAEAGEIFAFGFVGGLLFVCTGLYVLLGFYSLSVGRFLGSMVRTATKGLPDTKGIGMFAPVMMIICGACGIFNPLSWVSSAAYICTAIAMIRYRSGILALDAESKKHTAR